MDNMLNMDSAFLQNIFNTFPSPLFIVDADVRIAHYNTAAADMLGADGRDIIMERGGDIMQCINARMAPDGCGTAQACKDCVLRNSVNEAMGGNKVFRRKTRMRLQGVDGEEEFHYHITTSPFSYDGDEFVLLIIEDISELVQLRGLIPICSWCKKVRNDDDYWESVEVYFSTRADVDFTHGMCDECYTKEYGRMKECVDKLKE
jgi:hypothetical protein